MKMTKRRSVVTRLHVRTKTRTQLNHTPRLANEMLGDQAVSDDTRISAVSSHSSRPSTVGDRSLIPDRGTAAAVSSRIGVVHGITLSDSQTDWGRTYSKK